MPRKADAGTDGKDSAGNSAGGSAVSGASGNLKEGLSIDVRSRDICYRRGRSLTLISGPNSPKVDSDSPRQRRAPAKHERPERRHPCALQGRHGVHQLPLRNVQIPSGLRLISSHTDSIPRANDQAKVQGRKTINPGDILEAMRILEFGDFLPRLEAELASLCLFCYFFYLCPSH